ncbi:MULTISPECIES: hypothetical protein [Bacillus amyloliquefaciens group]|uniref:hypothetical protein n=1 Tax=Bacillus amyloliquefaciens group TaxID=1938374 RepID=UPI00104A674F|nr:hypothetical protein [Bacillus velezensis]MCY0092149.1 hypothetical protein [Bacillus velezensis]MEC0385615.1 hypothetical protein [Bacillus velezensis]MEC0388757.1 hypothetical protein [Bacillus velezensis]
MKNFNDYIYEFVDVKEDGFFVKAERMTYQELLKQQTKIMLKDRYINPSSREELQNQPKFADYLGPMYNGISDGKTVIRYETRKAYDQCSK